MNKKMIRKKINLPQPRYKREYLENSTEGSNTVMRYFFSILGYKIFNSKNVFANKCLKQYFFEHQLLLWTVLAFFLNILANLR